MHKQTVFQISHVAFVIGIITILVAVAAFETITHIALGWDEVLTRRKQ